MLQVDLFARLGLGCGREVDIDVDTKTVVVRERVAAEDLV